MLFSLKNFLTVLSLLAIVGLAQAQRAQESNYAKPARIHQVEVFAIPAVLMNSVTLGYGVVTSPKTEHVIRFKLFHAAVYGGSISAVYSLNKVIFNHRVASMYIPFWIQAKRHNRDFEDVNTTGNDGWYPKVKLLKIGIGSGIGASHQFKNGNRFRLEGNAGVFHRSEETNFQTENYTAIPIDLIAVTGNSSITRNDRPVVFVPTLQLKAGYIFSLN